MGRARILRVQVRVSLDGIPTVFAAVQRDLLSAGWFEAKAGSLDGRAGGWAVAPGKSCFCIAITTLEQRRTILLGKSTDVKGVDAPSGAEVGPTQDFPQSRV